MATYQSFSCTFTAVLITPAWTLVTIPAGSIDATITMQNNAVSFYVSDVNTGAATAGAFVAASGSYTFPGVCAKATSVYVCPSAATNAVLQVQTG